MSSHSNYTIERFGNEQEPIVVIDDFYSEPEKLIQHATQSTFTKNSDYYPGIRAKAPSAYLAERQKVLVDVIQNVFGITAGVNLLESNFSMVTFQPKELTVFQCFPHFDGLEYGRLAVLHYLFDAKKGGYGILSPSSNRI